MIKIISFVHISLDGFVAGPNGEMDWITVNEEIFDYIGERISRTKKALYGRKTYEMMDGYWNTAGDEPDASKHDIEHSKWYKNVHKIVISQSMNGKAPENTTIINDHIPERITTIKCDFEEGEEILVFGSPTATHSLMDLNMIDGFWLFVNPVILGKGLPLFKNINSKIKLSLLEASRKFSCGVIELNYRVNGH